MKIAEPLAVRALFSKSGVPDVRFELHRSSPHDFQIIENGRWREAFWSVPTHEQAQSGTSRPLTLREAWARCTKKRFPDYTASEFEELSLDAE